MKKVNKNKKGAKAFCSIALSMVLLIGNMSLLNLNVEAASFSESNNIEVEVLEAKLIENIEWDSETVPYTMLTRCQISVSGDSEGMHIDISTGCVGVASVLGVKDVKIYKKTWYGGWDLVATSSGGESYDRSSTGVTILYKNAVKDATYKITCVHYADVNGYTEGDNDSGSFTFTY